MTIAIITATIAIFFFLLALLSITSSGRDNVSSRMKHFTTGGDIRNNFKAAGKEVEELDTYGYLAPLFKLSKYFNRLPYVAVFDKKMLLAGIPLHGSEFVTITMLSALVVFIVSYILLLNIMQAMIVTIIWGFAIWFYVNKKINTRTMLFNNQLCESISMMSNAMKSGFSFLQTLDLIAKEMKPPISQEFARTLREMQLGMSMEEALKDLSERVQSDDLDLVLTAIIIQRQVGGNMSKVLDNIGNTIISRVRIQGDIRALTAEGRLSGYVVAVMPFAMAALFLFMDNKYFDEFLAHPLGMAAIVVGVVMQIIGILVIQKIVNIKF